MVQSDSSYVTAASAVSRFGRGASGQSSCMAARAVLDLPAPLGPWMMLTPGENSSNFGRPRLKPGTLINGQPPENQASFHDPPLSGQQGIEQQASLPQQQVTDFIVSGRYGPDLRIRIRLGGMKARHCFPGPAQQSGIGPGPLPGRAAAGPEWRAHPYRGPGQSHPPRAGYGYRSVRLRLGQIPGAGPVRAGPRQPDRAGDGENRFFRPGEGGRRPGDSGPPSSRVASRHSRTAPGQPRPNLFFIVRSGQIDFRLLVPDRAQGKRLDNRAPPRRQIRQPDSMPSWFPGVHGLGRSDHQQRRSGAVVVVTVFMAVAQAPEVDCGYA